MRARRNLPIFYSVKSNKDMFAIYIYNYNIYIYISLYNIYIYVCHYMSICRIFPYTYIYIWMVICPYYGICSASHIWKYYHSYRLYRGDVHPCGPQQVFAVQVFRRRLCNSWHWHVPLSRKERTCATARDVSVGKWWLTLKHMCNIHS